MKSSVMQKVGSMLFACLLGSTALAQTPTLSSEAQVVFDLAAELYPDLFTGGGDLQLAEGYTYRTFSSGVSVGIKDGSIYLVGGPFGADILDQGPINQVHTLLQDLKTSVTVQPTADVTSLFDLAAQLYPTIFTGGTNFQTSADGYLYRYYADSGVYAAIKDGSVFLRGGSFGTVYTNAGALNAVLSQLQAAVGGSDEGNNGGHQIPQGNFKLVVSGTITTSGIVSTSLPFSFQMDDMPAPDVSDQDDIEEAFKTALDGQTGVTITSFTYNVVESSADRVEFNVSVSATLSQNGVNMGYSYALNYKYTK